jgi:hypothetical protein
MSYFYVPDKLKPICQVCIYALGAPFWVAGAFTDGLMSNPEEMVFGEEVPIDLPGTGGVITGDIGDIDALREVLNEMEENSLLSS